MDNMKRAIPFPQANNMELIFNIYNSFPDDGLLKEDIALKYDIDVRQGAYYLDALVFLDLVQKINVTYFPTMSILTFNKITSKKRRREWFCAKILEHEFFSDLIQIEDDGTKSVASIAIITEKIRNTYDFSLSTARRRASSISAWLDWIRENSTGILRDE